MLKTKAGGNIVSDEVIDYNKSIKTAHDALESTNRALEKSRNSRLKNANEHDSKKDLEAFSASSSDEEDEHTCRGECLRYKYMYENLKKHYERMHKAATEYDPEREHPEILKHHKKHHKKHFIDADDYDTDDKLNGKKSAARDFNNDKTVDKIGDDKDNKKDLENAKKEAEEIAK